MERLLSSLALAVWLALSASCDYLPGRESELAIESGRKKAAAGNFRGAIKSYEAALDGTAKTAEIHYRLAAIYDEKLRSPADALHHFSRYLDYEPNGKYAKEARAYKKEGELKLLTSINKGSFVSQDEAVRLKNENLSLRKTIVELRAQKKLPVAKAAKKGESVQKPIPPGSRTHTVQQGETLASIAAKYYRNKARWKDIQDANFVALEGTVNIKPGQTLIVP